MVLKNRGTVIDNGAILSDLDTIEKAFRGNRSALPRAATVLQIIAY
jgi:hypothetical protein